MPPLYQLEYRYGYCFKEPLRLSVFLYSQFTWAHMFLCRTATSDTFFKRARNGETGSFHGGVFISQLQPFLQLLIELMAQWGKNKGDDDFMG